MSGALKDGLDDVAADAVSGLRVDLAGARALTVQRRSRLRVVGSMAMLAAAAAVLVGFVVVPVVADRADRSPAAGPGAGFGLPQRWFATVGSAPDIRSRHLAAASMILSGPGGDVTLVSADAKRYVTLPQGAHDRYPSLSADGRKVAWLTADPKLPLQVNVVTLATGYQVSVSMPSSTGFPDRTDPAQLVWAGGSLFLVTEGNGEGSTWRIDATRGTAALLQQCELPVAADASGRPYLGVTKGMQVPDACSPVDGEGRVPLRDPSRDYEGPGTGLLVSPDGESVATVLQPKGNGPKVISLTGTRDERWFVEAISAKLLAWVPEGIVLSLEIADSERTDGRGVALVLLDPDTGTFTNIAHREEGDAVPLAVAAGVTASDPGIYADPPDYPLSTAARAWIALVLVLLVGIGILSVRGRRSRGGSYPE